MSSSGSGWQRALAFADRALERCAELGAPLPGDGKDLLSQRTVFTNAASVGQRSMGGKCRLLESSDGQHEPAQRNLTRHRHIASDRTIGEKRSERGEHRESPLS